MQGWAKCNTESKRTAEHAIMLNHKNREKKINLISENLLGTNQQCNIKKETT